jgi:adenosylcobinamide kinase/adenosylcobinamide-phosphate guanylyltransferase
VLGLLHQRLAALCGQVTLMVAGLPMPVKGGAA